VIQERETILPAAVKKVIRDTAISNAGMILNKLRELQVDLRSNPAVFLGGGSVLYRPFIESSPMVAHADFITDQNANALGYEMLAARQMNPVSRIGGALCANS